MEVCGEIILTTLACLLLTLTAHCHLPTEETDSPDTADTPFDQGQQVIPDIGQFPHAASDTGVKRSEDVEGEQHEMGISQHEEKVAKEVDDERDPGDSVINTLIEETKINSFSERGDDDTQKKQEKASEHAKVVLEAFGTLDTESEGIVAETQSENQQEEDIWTEETDASTEQKQSGGRRFFSLMNLIKFLLNPVIEEFQEGEKSSTSHEAAASATSTSTTINNNNKTDVMSVSTGNSSEAGEKEEKKNSTEPGKKTKFQCAGRNITENTTAVVKVVNSTILLELLSFDKNHTSSDCVLVMFYAPWCHFCAATAPHYNAVARAFPQLEVLAVDTVHFSNLNARFGTVAVPNIMLFHQSRSAVRFNHTERHFQTLLQFIINTTGLDANSSVELSDEDYAGPLSSMPTEETDYLLWFAWCFIIVCSGHIFISSQAGQRAIEKVMVLWQEHQHQHIE